MAPTINTWLNWYISQWDIFIDSFDEINEKITKYNVNLNYKKADDSSYQIYRQMSQVIDVMCLDINHLKYNNRKLISSVLLPALAADPAEVNFTGPNLFEAGLSLTIYINSFMIDS